MHLIIQKLYLIAGKFYNLMNIVLSGIIHPDLTVSNIHALNKSVLNWLKGGEDTKKEETILKKDSKRQRIRGVILDVDGTLRNQPQYIPQSSIDWIEMLKESGLKVALVSNGKSDKVGGQCEELGIPYIPYALKPTQKGFDSALDQMNLRDPRQVLVVGNALGEDIMGGNRKGMMTAWVQGVKKDGNDDEHEI